MDLIQRPLAYEPCMLPLYHRDCLIKEAKSFDLYNKYKNGYITTSGYSQGAIWFYNSRAPQICFWNVWDPKIDKIRLRPYVYMYTMHITPMNYAYSFNRHSKSDISRNIATYNQGAEKGGGLMVSSLASTFFGIFETFLTICSIYYSYPPLAYNELLLPTLN